MPDEQPTAVDAPHPARWGPGRFLALAGLFAVLAGAGFAAGTLPRLNQDHAVREQAAANAAQPPRVAVATATRSAPDAERVLPGNAMPLNEISIHPRTTGYLKWWKVDRGDRVKAGQLLA